MSKLVLEFHDWREVRPDKDSELAAMFLFTLTTESDRQAGTTLDHDDVFWTEVELSRDLAGRGRWPQLSKAEKFKAMYRWARAKIEQRGRKLRQAPMFWTATGPLAEGPPAEWDLRAMRFPKPEVVSFEANAAIRASEQASRQAAGLTK